MQTHLLGNADGNSRPPPGVIHVGHGGATGAPPPEEHDRGQAHEGVVLGATVEM